MEARIANDGSVLDTLAPAHQQALAWFQDRAGQQIGWPEPLDGLFLLNKAKGIHKPSGWAHALSVRQSLGGPYADRDVVTLPGGIWTYDYYREGADPAARDSDFTNRALMQNMGDGVRSRSSARSRLSHHLAMRCLGLRRSNPGKAVISG